MPLEKPSRDDLRHLAEVNHLHLSSTEEVAYLELFAAFLPRFDELEALPEPARREIGPPRRSWVPDPGTNPFNAIVRACEVRAPGPAYCAESASD